MRTKTIPILLAAALAAACAGPASEPDTEAPPSVGPALTPEAERALAGALERSAAAAESIRDALQPVPLMRSADEARLRRFGNPEHMARARSLGARPRDSTHLRTLLDEGRLVELEDSSAWWVVRDLDYSRPIVTPDARALLEEIGSRFQERMRERGLPPLRLEVTSALRTPESQDALREENPNAAAGVSTHEFGTTVDLAYSGYAAPAAAPDVEVPGLGPFAGALRAASIEAAANEKSRELQAILGEVLAELQSEGAVLVTLERLQPVYHITVARRFDDP